MPTVEEILEAISRLSPSEQAEVARRLLERLARRRPAQATPDLVLLFDGGSMGNPGPGYGSFVLTWPGGKEVHRRVQFHRDLTNNEAEYATLIAALKEVHRRLGADAGRVTLEVRGDSQLVAYQVQGKWQARDPRMRELRDRVQELLAPFRAWRYVRVPRREVVARLGH